MRIESHAQNLEDIMLWRALKNISSGFYIDIGANDPNIDSVTRLFYDRGWTGINAEPLAHHHDQLAQCRPHDINLQVAVGEKCGSIDIWESEKRGWASASNDVIEKHKAEGLSGQLHTVPQTTLSRLCEEYAPANIHFLKIDVEGMEKSVLEGANFEKFRPWILVVEATEPNSTQENYEEWEKIVIKADYLFAYCDGLNRFYVAKEKRDLMAALKYPPNIFDNFKTPEVARLEVFLDEARNKAESLFDENQKLKHANVLFKSESYSLQQEINEHYLKIEELEDIFTKKNCEIYEFENLIAEKNREIYEANCEIERQRQAFLKSTSWRMTAPFRALKTALVTLFIMLFKVPLRVIAKPLMKKGYKHQGFRRFAAKILDRFPMIKARVVLFMNNQGLGAISLRSESSQSEWLSPLDEPESSRKPVENPRNISETERFIRSEL